MLMHAKFGSVLLEMAYDDICVLRHILVITATVPGNWQEPWKQTAFRAYAYILDVLYLFCMITKVSYTIRVTDMKQDYLDDFFDCLIIVSLVLERMMIRRKSKELIQFFQKIDEFPKPGPHVKNLIKIYKKQARHVLMIFGVLIVSCLLEAVINFLVNYCDSNVVKDEERICKLFVMETDLPSVLVRSPLYGLLFVCNLIQLTLMGFLGFLSFIMIPVLVIKLSCQFRITADSFERRLKVGVYKTRSVESSINGEEDLESVIKQHQYTLEVATMMTKTFHTIILLKLVFLVMPIIVVAYCLSQFPIGSFDFLRFTALFLVLLIKLATFCFFGEQLTYHSLMVYRAVYMNQWYRMDKEDKKMLLIVATRAIRPARLEVWPHFVPVSFETFVNVCQFSYSVYSVLMMVSSK